MTQTQRPQDGEAAADAADADADEVAALLDRIAMESSPTGATQPQPAAPPEPLPVGPALASSEFIERVLQLIASLKAPRDTEAHHVSKMLGVQLGRDGKDWAVHGALSDGGSYAVFVDALYREQPDDWTVRISLHPLGWRGDPRSSENALEACPFPQEVLRRHVAALGYTVNEGWRDRVGRERATYFKALPKVSLIVTADVYRTSGDSEPGKACVATLLIATEVREGADE